jgi:hypothetical protein
MHLPINVKSSNNTSKWQMGFNSAFKGLIRYHISFKIQLETNNSWNGICRNFGSVTIQDPHLCFPPEDGDRPDLGNTAFFWPRPVFPIWNSSLTFRGPFIFYTEEEYNTVFLNLWSAGNCKPYALDREPTELILLPILNCCPGSSVGMATGYGLDGPGIESLWRRDFPYLSRPAMGPTQPPV